MVSAAGLGPPDIKHQVFVSSTSQDLKLHRAAVRDTLEAMTQFPVAMEQFGAQEGDATEVSLDMLSSAQVYIGIVAWRYGFIPDGETESITCLEYREARKRNLPCYIFLADPATDELNVSDPLFPLEVRDPEHRRKLLEFRRELMTNHVVDFFTTSGDLGRRVAVALNRYLMREQRREFLAGLRVQRLLPPRSPQFFGREHELQRLCQLLMEGQTVAVTAAVNGMAGVGKSALAAEVMHLIAADPAIFPNGIAYVSCENRVGLPGLAWVYLQILDHWGITLSRDDQVFVTTPDAEAELHERTLRTRLLQGDTNTSTGTALLLLDNIERDFPIDRAVQVLTSLRLAVMITARHDLPSSIAQVMRLDVLEPNAAAQLFLERYTSRGGVVDPAGETEHIEQVVAFLGQLPLAIELAAARAARSLNSISLLLQELRQADILDKLRDPLDPTKSVRYSFEKSLALLTMAQRQRFAAIGIADGNDWPRPLIEQLLESISQTRPKAALPSDDLDLFSALALISVVAPENTGHPTTEQRITQPRVRLHPLLHELARDEWQASAPPVQQAGVASLLSAVATWVDQHRTDFSSIWREERLIASTVRTAAQVAREPRKIIHMVTQLESYFEIGGHWELGQELTQYQIAMCHQIRDRSGESRALRTLGSLAFNRGDEKEANTRFREALKIAVGARNRMAEQQCLIKLGRLESRQKNAKEAEHHLRRAVELANREHNQEAKSAACTEWGSHCLRTEHVSEAHQRFMEALTAGQNGSVSDENLAHATFGLGRVARLQNEKDVAEGHFQESLRLSRAASDFLLELQCLLQLYFLASSTGRQKEAEDYSTQGLALARKLGDRTNEYKLLSSLGDLLEGIEEKQTVKDYFRMALSIGQERGDKDWQLSSLMQLGRLSASLREEKDARQYLVTARQLAIELDNSYIELDILKSLAQLESESGNDDRATQYFTDVLRLARKLSDHYSERTALNGLAELAQSVNDSTRAMGYLNEVVRISQTIADRQGEGEAMVRLGDIALELGDKRKTKSQFERALVIAEKLGDRRGELAALDGLGNVEDKYGSKAAARRYFERALAIANELEEYRRDLDRLQTLGRLADELKDRKEAKRYLEQALGIAEWIGSQRRAAEISLMLGHVHEVSGDGVESRRYFEQAKSLYEALGERLHVAEMLRRMSRLEKRFGTKETSQFYLDQAQAIERGMTALRHGGHNQGTLSLRPNTSNLDLLQVLKVLRAAQDHLGEAETLNNLAVLAQKAGRPDQAFNQFALALDIYRRADDRVGQATALTNLGLLESKLNHYESAEYCYTQALRLYRKLHNAFGEVEMLTQLGHIAEAQGLPEEAVEHYEKAVLVLQHIDDAEKAIATKTSLARAREKAMVKARYSNPEGMTVIVPGRQIKPWRRRRWRWPW